MKKIIIWILMILAVLLLAYVLLNQIDASTPAPVFNVKDLPKPVFDKSNGYYLLWALTEPEHVDAESDAIYTKYRQLGDPAFDNERFIREFDRDLYLQLARQKFKELDAKVTNRGRDWTNFPENSHEDWLEKITSQREQVTTVKTELKVWLERFEKMIAKPTFTDFGRYRFDTPLPNLLVWLNTGKLFNTLQMLETQNGNWEQGVAAILRHIEFCKRTQKGSTILIVNLVGKALLTHSLRALASIMNQKECPESVYTQILAGLPPIEFAEFSSSNSIIAETIAFKSLLDENGGDEEIFSVFINRFFTRLLLQKNRTYRILLDRVSSQVNLEKTPPYQRTNPIKAPEKLAQGGFWWLVNPSGKLILDWLGTPMGMEVVKSYRAKAYYDMVRIAAELHLNYRGDKPVEAILANLDAYRNLDPFSGKPYRWHEQKQELYSLGQNGLDDGGIEKNATLNKDFIMPCILYVKPEIMVKDK